jgi:hypothetical protein
MQALLTLVLLSAPALSVDASSACAPREALERELARAPVRFVASGGDLVLSLNRTGPAFRVTLARRGGALALERSLPTRDCPEAVAAAAVILERFVRELAVSAGRDEATTAAGDRAGSARQPPTAPATRSAAVNVAPSPAGAAPPREAAPPTAATRQDGSAPRSPSAPSPQPAARDTAARRAAPDASPPATTALRPATAGPSLADTAPARDVPPQAREGVASAPAPSELTAPNASPGRSPAGELATAERAPATTPSAPPPRDARLEPAGAPDTAPAPGAPLPLGAAGGPERAGPRLRLTVTAGAGLAAPSPSTASPLLALDVGLILAERWRVGLTGAFSFGGAVTVVDDAGRTRGTLSSRDVTVLGSLMACTPGGLSACGGARGGLRLGIGSAAGPFLFQTRPAFAAAPTVGPAGRLGLQLGAFTLALDATLLVNLTTPALAIDGLATAIATPRIEGLVFLAAGVTTP